MAENIITHRGEKCPACGRYMSRYPTVDGVIVHYGKILLMLRNAGQEIGKWSLIGGHVDWDETVEEAIIREVKEEVGLSVTVKKLLGVYSDPTRDPNDAQSISTTFILETNNLETNINQSEAKEVRWFPFNALPHNIAFDHRKIIDDYLKKQNV